MRKLCLTIALPASAAARLGSGTARAAPFHEQHVQAPSIGLLKRGSIAGALSKRAFGPADLARGAFAFPLPIDLPGDRGPLLANVVPGYTTEGGLGEWGMGWDMNLAIKRIRLTGEIDYRDD